MGLINISYKNYSDQSLLVESGQVKFSMTKNIHFPDPVPGLDELEVDIDKYSAALDNMGNGVNATLVKNEKRKKLQETLKKLGLYVETVADGNAIIAGSSGFRLKAKSSPIGVLPKPSNFKVMPGLSRGSIKLSVGKIHGAKMYQFEYKPGTNLTDDNWKNETDSHSSIVINNLQSGQEYTFRAVGLGTNPTRVYSDEVNSFVL